MTGGHAHHAGASDSDFTAAMAQAMERMMHDMHLATPLGDPDRDFLAMMIPHHRGAVDMAEMVLRHGRDPLVRQLAEGIIAGQSVEIAAMQARLEMLAADGGRDTFPMPTGTRGPA